MSAAKVRVSFAVIGQIDGGKSTVAGHLLCKCGVIPDRVLDKLRQAAEDMGRASFAYAWVMDSLKSERERGITIEASMKEFQTPTHVFTVIDTPGHRDYIRNMITGATQADAAMLVTSADRNAHEGAAQFGKAHEHALLAFMLGVKQVMVAVNKMDHESVMYSQDRYEEIKDKVAEYLTKIGFKSSLVQFVPVSGWLGDNLIDRSTNMPWYDGPTLLEALEQWRPPRRSIDKPLRMLIDNVYKISGIGTVVIGRVETGVLTPGMTISIAPKGLTAQVVSVEMHHRQLSEAVAGDIVGVNIKGVEANDLKRGFVISDPQKDPARGIESFTAEMVIIEHPGQIRPGYIPVLHCHTSHIACNLVAITEKIDRETGKVVEENPEFAVAGDACTVEFRPNKPMIVEAFHQYPQLGRFVLRDLNQIVAVGIIKSVKRAA